MRSEKIDLKNLRDGLECYYEKKFPDKSDKKAGFADFIILLLEKIEQYYSKINQPLNILTISQNVTDGIGDFVNQADFTAWLCEVFDQFENIRVQSISILEKGKFTLAEKLMPSNVKEKGVVFVAEPDDLSQLDNVKDLRNIFLSDEVAVTMSHDPKIGSITSSTELLINIAHYMNLYKYTLLKLLSQVKKETLTQSRAEYGPFRGKKPYGDVIEDKLYYETCMGAEQGTTGLKFYKSLQSLCKDHSSAELKAKLFAEITSKSFTGSTVADSIKNIGFAFGYIQKRPYSILFAHLMITKSKDKKDGVVMMVNLSHFKDISTNKYFMEHLKISGYEKIRLISNDGTASEIKVSSSLENNTQEVAKEETRKILTLVEFRGTSQTDKEKIIAMSDMVAGSGNSSFSEMLSAGRFPFIQPIEHVRPFYNSFINEIEKADIQNGKLLQDYLLLNINCITNDCRVLNDALEPVYDEEKINNNTRKLIEMISSDDIVDKIMAAWNEYCAYLEKNRNAYDDFNEIISTFIVQKGLEIDPAILATLLTFIPPETVIAGYTLLHLCIEKNLSDLTNQLIEEHPALINAKCMYKDYTPLMMAARYRRYMMVDKLLGCGASIAQLDKDHLSVVDHAIITKDAELIKLLLNKLTELKEETSDPYIKLYKMLIKLHLDDYLKNNPKKENDPFDMFKSINKTLLHSLDPNTDKLIENIDTLKKNISICNTIDDISKALEKNANSKLAEFLAEKLAERTSLTSASVNHNKM